MDPNASRYDLDLQESGPTDVLAQFAGEKFRFIAPDALLASDEQADWLVVDEAAAIPAPLL